MKNLHQFLIIVLSMGFSISNAQNQNNQIEGINYTLTNIDFTNKNDLLTSSGFSSIIIVGIADMNADGLDDIIRLEDAKILTIEYQLSGNQFENYIFGTIANNQQWNIAVADVDNNGFNDILVGGLMDGVKLLKANDFGTDYEETLLPDSYFFSQGSNFSDIDNDGFMDIFVCNDNAESRIWKNDGSGNFSTADDWIDMSTFPVSDNSGNYASVWTDFDNDNDLDLYISKCKTGAIDPQDPRRVNQLFINNNGIFTEDAEMYGLKSGAQSWTSDFQDIDNDGDLDCFIINHDSPCQLFENIGNGFFNEITLESGLNITTNHLQGLLRDFDNDGFVDVLVAGNFGYEYYQNNGNKTFLKIDDLFGNYLMSTFAVGDLDHDGFLDIYSGSLTSNDILWINGNNDNHYFAVDLVGDSSNVNALGARLELHGPWGIQIREVRSGESYGIMNGYTQLFGLGVVDYIDSLVIKWPSGLVEIFDSPLIDQFLKVIENDCAYPGKNIFSIGITTVCSGDELELSAPAGNQYQWSNGTETQQLLISEGGTYSVTVTNDNGCSTISNPINIIQDPDETPTISIVSGTTTFCSGNTVILQSSEADAYLWSNGFTARSTIIAQSGDYSVTIPGFCQDFTSDTVSVTVISIPNDPIIENDTISTIPGYAILMAEGDSLKWFDELSSDLPIDSGTVFETPFISETTSFFVEAMHEIDGVICKSSRVEVLAVVDTTTAVYPITELEIISVYPNPANQEVVIEFTNEINLPLQLELRDINGRLVLSKKITPENGVGKEIVPVSSLSSGIYMVYVRSDENIFIQKIIIQNK